MTTDKKGIWKIGEKKKNDKKKRERKREDEQAGCESVDDGLRGRDHTETLDHQHRKRGGV